MPYKKYKKGKNKYKVDHYLLSTLEKIIETVEVCIDCEKRKNYKKSFMVKKEKVYTIVKIVNF
jgi:hypothetical protein